MSFLAYNEFLILQNPGAYWKPQPPYFPTPENKAALREAGIQTSLEHLDWSIMEPDKGSYDFTNLEGYLKVNRNAGMKTLFPVPGELAPAWMPNDWMLQRKGGGSEMRGDATGYRNISFWNEEAKEYLDGYLRELIDRYHAPDVLFIHAENQGGEGMLPCEPFYFDPFALADYKDKFGNKAYPDISTPETKDWLKKAAIQRVLRIYDIINKHGDIWNQQQLLMNQWSESTINYAQHDIFRAYQREFPESNLTLLQYTYFDDAHSFVHHRHVDSIKAEFQADIIVEAMYCQGLPTTTPKSIAKGYRGQIIGVAHPMAPADGLDNWMVNAIRKSHQTWLESLQ
jgi:hypothetical protein